MKRGQQLESTVTLRMIAEAAGVSRATASRALRDNPVISESVRKKVKTVAVKLGYAPDPEAQRLMAYLRSTRKQRFESTIGILNAYQPSQRINEDYYTRELIQGAKQRAVQLGFAVDMLNLREDGMTPRRVDQIIKARSIRGLLIPPMPEPLFDVDLEWESMALVAATSTVQTLRLHRTLPHNHHNKQLLLDTALNAGYRRIGLISWHELEERQMHAMSATYALNGHLQHRFEPLPIYNWIWQDFHVQAQHLRSWFQENKPDCILAFNTFALDALASVGLRAPEHFGYLSYGEAPEYITQVNQLPQTVGSAAMDLLSSLVLRSECGLPDAPKTVLIEGKLSMGSTIRQH
ncbi:MAG: LacI family transcriptional regulator [Verrucomicrobia bacterium]|nr:LacI family transcriptional regulator [Verrucomicrobiota bacterium]